MAIALNTVIVDGQEYKPGDVIPDFKSIKCVDTREPRKYQGLSADVSVLNDVIAKYASGGASCFMSDTGEYYEYDRKEKTFKLITNITERGFGSEKAYGALKHMLKNVTVSDEKIQSAVTDYLTVNPVLPGATTEQAQQIEQNKTDITSLKTDLSNKITKFYASNQGETHITDSDNGKIMDMMLYGKSSQDGTPTIDNPVEIESVVNPKVVVYGKNIAKKVTVVDEPQQYITSLYIVADLRPSATYVLSFECASGYSGYINEKLFEQITFRGTGNRQRVVCKTKSALQSSELSEKGWRIAKNTPENTIVPKFTNVMLERISASIAYEPYHEQTITLPCTLNAIPVSSGGNVVIDGQQYIADYVDVERGKVVRIVDSSKLDNTQSIIDKTEWLLAEKQEIDLTTEQIAAFKELATYYPTTNISVNSEQLDGYAVFNYPISIANGWNYVKQQLNDNRDYIYDMDLQSAEAYVNSEYAVALTELEV